MKIDLSEVMSVSNKEIQKSVPIEMKTIDYRGFQYPLKEQYEVLLLLQNVGNRKFQFKAEFNVELLIPCDRCLEDVTVPFSVSLEKKVDLSEYADEEQLYELGYIDKEKACMDVDRLVYEEVTVLIPMQVLCKDDCKGICSVCGANLNLKECGCDRHVPDPRMAVVHDIFSKFKEV